jgi:Na+/H+ antiporter NhaD/arsenite permease-like protein
MEILLIAVFFVTYAAITLEHQTGVNKSAPALIGAVVLWAIYAFGVGNMPLVTEHLNESLVTTAQIIFFLMGAMTIVEVVDAHGGFEIITSRIRTKRLATLMWLVGTLTFFLSAVLDNLTTAIVMVSLMKKLLSKREDRLVFAGVIIIAANAGGAWSPIGDVTTTMLWIGGQITAAVIMQSLFLPSLIAALVPMMFFSWRMRHALVESPAESLQPQSDQYPHANLMFFLGLGILIAVPVFKTLTGLPPYLAMLLGLGLVWLVGDLIHRGKDPEEKQELTLASSLSRIDMGSLTFFIGILLAVATLEHSHVLTSLANWLDTVVGRQDVIVVLIGLASAVVDNVPLVAAAMGMYDLAKYPTDSFLWEFLAFCAGTGGSILVIGSAAGVAAMGLEKINFFWYVKHISGLALVGYFAGAFVYILQFNLTH